MEDLIRAGTLDRTLANHLEDYVLARRNILISGGTGTGKRHFYRSSENSFRRMNGSSSSRTQQRFTWPENLVRFEARREQNGLPAVPFGIF